MTDVTEQVPTEVPATERLSHPRTLAEAVQLSPQGRLSLPPRGPDIPRPETTEVDHYGTSKHWTITEGITQRQSNRSVFSKSDFGGTEMPAFRNPCISQSRDCLLAMGAAGLQKWDSQESQQPPYGLGQG